MKIALIEAIGFVEVSIVKDAPDRGPEVTAIARHADTLQPHGKLRPVHDMSRAFRDPFAPVAGQLPLRCIQSRLQFCLVLV